MHVTKTGGAFRLPPATFFNRSAVFSSPTNPRRFDTPVRRLHSAHSQIFTFN